MGPTSIQHLNERLQQELSLPKAIIWKKILASQMHSFHSNPRPPGWSVRSPPVQHANSLVGEVKTDCPQGVFCFLHQFWKPECLKGGDCGSFRGSLSVLGRLFPKMPFSHSPGKVPSQRLRLNHSSGDSTIKPLLSFEGVIDSPLPSAPAAGSCATRRPFLSRLPVRPRSSPMAGVGAFAQH